MKRLMLPIFAFLVMFIAHHLSSQTYEPEINDIAWNADGTLLAVGRDDGTVEIVTREQKSSQLFQISDWDVTSVEWSIIESNTLAISTFEGPVRVIRLIDGDLGIVSELKTESNVEILAWSPDGKWLASLGHIEGRVPDYSVVKIWDTKNWTLEATYQTCKGCSLLIDIAWNPQKAKQLLITGAEDYFGSYISLWNIADDKVLWSVQEPESGIIYVAWSLDSETFAAATTMEDGTIVNIRDGKKGEVIDTLTSVPLHWANISWYPSDYLAIADLKQVQIWDVETAQTIQLFETNDFLQSVVWSPDGKTLAYTYTSGEARFITVEDQ